MAVLSADVLAAMRNSVSTLIQRDPAGAITWTKPQFNAAAQAVEDLFESSFRAAAVAAINTATAPLVIPNAVKREIVKHVLLQKLERNI